MAGMQVLMLAPASSWNSLMGVIITFHIIWSTQPTRHTLELSLDWRQVSYTSKEMSQIRDQQVKRSQGLPSTHLPIPLHWHHGPNPT